VPNLTANNMLNFSVTAMPKVRACLWACVCVCVCMLLLLLWQWCWCVASAPCLSQARVSSSARLSCAHRMWLHMCVLHPHTTRHTHRWWARTPSCR
jgi:hypothetical protein